MKDSPSIVVGYHWDALAMISKSDYFNQNWFVGDPLDGPFLLRQSLINVFI